MASLSDLTPGFIGFGPIHGGTGLFVGAAQVLMAAGERGWVWRTGVREWWEKRHVLVITSASIPQPIGYGICNPKAVQAMPGGAEEIELGPEHWTKEWTYIRPAYAEGSPFEIGYENRSQGFKVAAAARGYVGTPYDFATYAAIPAYRRGLKLPGIKRVISDTSTMMCSRLADAALRDAGWHAFDDGRLPGDVTPSELYRALIHGRTSAILHPEEG